MYPLQATEALMYLVKHTVSLPNWGILCGTHGTTSQFAATHIFEIFFFGLIRPGRQVHHLTAHILINHLISTTNHLILAANHKTKSTSSKKAEDIKIGLLRPIQQMHVSFDMVG